MIMWMKGGLGGGKRSVGEGVGDGGGKWVMFEGEEMGLVVKERVGIGGRGEYEDVGLWRGVRMGGVREIGRN